MGIDFSFNIGNEFGGMHPAIILKNFNSTIGKIDGKYLSIINEKIGLEFFE